MKWFLKYAGWQAYAVFAAVLLALGAAWYAQVAGLPPVYGLYGSILPVLLLPVLAHCIHQDEEQ